MSAPTPPGSGNGAGGPHAEAGVLRRWPSEDGKRITVAAGVELAISSCPPARRDGHAFLCFHGLASNRRLFDEVASLLVERGFGVLSVDLRGHGGSSAPESGYDLATVVADLCSLLDQVPWLGRPVVVGQSWGGNVALELGIALGPARCRGVVAIDGGTIELQTAFPTFEACLEALDPPDLTGVTPDQLRQAISEHHPDFSATGIEAQLANFAVVDGRLRPHLDRRHHHEILADLWRHRPSERWALLGVPLLLVPAVEPGTEAGEAKLAAARLAAERAGAPVEVEVFLHADHDLHVQHPGRLADVLEQADARLFDGTEPPAGADDPVGPSTTTSRQTRRRHR